MSPTSVTDTSSTTMDHIFTISPEMHYNSGVLPTLCNHYCTYTILDLESPVNFPKIVKFRNYNKFSVYNFYWVSFPLMFSTTFICQQILVFHGVFRNKTFCEFLINMPPFVNVRLHCKMQPLDF